ncbi:MAG TPA: DUF2911 domain-containing protein [Lacunisphaera sp.]|jgi:hypothetical protein
MKIIQPSLVLLAAVVLTTTGFCADATATPAATPLPARRPALSPHATISTVIGDRRTGDRITITYGRPYTNDYKTGLPRKIWGGLVRWDKADRLGADEATLLITQQPLMIGTTTVPTGAYTLYIIPSENGPSQLAFSTDLGKWGIPVDEKKDLARFDLIKASLEPSVDQLTIDVVAHSATTGEIKIQWENTQYSLPFTVKK